jgi:hypothetical protein
VLVVKIGKIKPYAFYKIKELQIMKLRKFNYKSRFIHDVFINPEYVTSVIRSDESEDETLIYLVGDEVIRVTGKAEDIIFELNGQRF